MIPLKEKINSALDRFYEHSGIAVTLTILVTYVVWLLVGMLGKGVVMEYAIRLVFGLTVLPAFLWLRKGHMYSCGLKKHGMKNLKLILPVLLLTLAQFINPIIQFGSELLNADLLIYAGVLSVEAGICEELMDRCLPLGNTLFRKATRKQFIGLAFLSSAIFGLLHLGNLFKGGETIQVITQVIFGIGMGMTYAAIYFRTGSIIPSIIIHALWDFASFLNPANVANGAISGAPKGLEAVTAQIADELSPEAAAMGPIFFVVTQVILALFWLGVAMFLMRKSKWEEIKANFTK